MYVDYSFYTGTYGGRLSKSDFTHLEPKAEYYIRYLTMKNCFETVREAVQMAVCRAVEIIASNTTIDAASGAEKVVRPVKSESNDGYSVTYGGYSGDGEMEDVILGKRILKGIYPYLLPTGLLYRGLNHDHQCGDYDL